MSGRLIRSEVLDQSLIEAVRDHPDLYDKNSYSYNDYAAKERIWTKIASHLGIEVDFCRTRWKNLRDTFVKSRKKSRWKGVGENRVKVNSWKFARLMDFLVPFIREYDYLLTFKDGGVVYEDEDYEITTNDNDGEDGDAGSAQASSEDEAEAGTSKRKLRSTSSSKDASPRQPDAATPEVQDEPETRPKKIFRASTWQAPQPKMDDIEAFFYSMGQSVKKLPAHLQSLVKLKVCQAVTEAELEYHTPTTSRTLTSENGGSEDVDVKPWPIFSKSS